MKLWIFFILDGGGEVMIQPCTSFHVEENLYWRYPCLGLVVDGMIIVIFILLFIHGRYRNIEVPTDVDVDGASVSVSWISLVIS